MKYFSMFSGIGGFELGIQNAYRKKVRRFQEDSERVDAVRSGLLTEEGEDFGAAVRLLSASPSDLINQRPLCVGYSEIDKYAINTYERHFGRYEDDNQPQAQQLQAEQGQRIDNSDSLQRTTTSDRKRGHRNYGDATKINPADLPDFDLLVGGFPCQAFSVAGKRLGFNDTRGTLFFDIARILAEKRPRHLVLENVKGLLSHDGGKTFQTIIGVLADLGYFVEWQVLNSKDFGVPQNRERVFIVGHLGGEPRRKVFPIFGTDSKDIIVSGVLDTETWRKRHEQIRRFHSVEGLSPTIPTGTGGGVMTKIEVKPRIRRLTPLECERLQGFPDGWTVGSDTQRYKQCGNAVTVNVVAAVIGALV